MYLYTWLITWTVVHKNMTDHLNRTIQKHDWSLEPYYSNTWLITWTVLYKYMTDHLSCSVQIMYLYTTVQVSDDVFVYYGSSDQSCICIPRFKWEVMYVYTMVQESGDVFVYYGSSERSCICILRLKRAVMYLYTTVETHDFFLEQ
jgi:hypothetical protein